LSIVQQAGEDYGYAKFFGGVDAVIIGRGTYDVVRGFPSWPYSDKVCVVLTHDPPVPGHGETFYAGELAPLLAQLSAEGVRRVYVDGGVVIRSFLRGALVDDLTLSIIPVILGDGIRLFGDTGDEQRLRFVSSQAFPSGLMQVTYDVSGRGLHRPST
jgi:dihydrofolate reductase